MGGPLDAHRRVGPRRRGAGDEVVGASINGHGRLVVFVTTVGAHTKLAQIVRLLEAAQGSRAPVQPLADRVSAVFVPRSLMLAAATCGRLVADRDDALGQRSCMRWRCC